MTMGTDIATLSPGEAKLAGQISSKTTGLMRSWEYWSMRVANKVGVDAFCKPGGSKAGPSRTKAKRTRARQTETAAKRRR